MAYEHVNVLREIRERERERECARARVCVCVCVCVCACVWVRACVRACMSAREPACVIACVPFCLPAWLRACVWACVNTQSCQFAWLFCLFSLFSSCMCFKRQHRKYMHVKKKYSKAIFGFLFGIDDKLTSPHDKIHWILPSTLTLFCNLTLISRSLDCTLFLTSFFEFFYHVHGEQRSWIVCPLMPAFWFFFKMKKKGKERGGVGVGVWGWGNTEHSVLIQNKRILMCNDTMS